MYRRGCRLSLSFRIKQKSAVLQGKSQAARRFRKVPNLVQTPKCGANTRAFISSIHFSSRPVVPRRCLDPANPVHIVSCLNNHFPQIIVTMQQLLDLFLIHSAATIRQRTPARQSTGLYYFKLLRYVPSGMSLEYSPNKSRYKPCWF